MSQAVSFDTFCPVEFGHDTEMPKNNIIRQYGVICSIEQLPPYILLSYNRRLLTNLHPVPRQVLPVCENDKSPGDLRETSEGSLSLLLVLSPGQSTERCLHDYLRPATRTLVSERERERETSSDLQSIRKMPAMLSWVRRGYFRRKAF